MEMAGLCLSRPDRGASQDGGAGGGGSGGSPTAGGSSCRRDADPGGGKCDEVRWEKGLQGVVIVQSQYFSLAICPWHASVRAGVCWPVPAAVMVVVLLCADCAGPGLGGGRGV